MIQTIPLIYSSSEFDLFFHGTHLKNKDKDLKTLFHNTLNQICPSGPLVLKNLNTNRRDPSALKAKFLMRWNSYFGQP